MLPYLSFPCQSKRSCPGGYLAQLLGRHPLTAPWGIIQMRDDDRMLRDKRDDDDDDDATTTTTIASQLLIAKDISQT